MANQHTVPVCVVRAPEQTAPEPLWRGQNHPTVTKTATEPQWLPICSTISVMLLTTLSTER